MVYFELRITYHELRIAYYELRYFLIWKMLRLRKLILTKNF